MNEQQVTAADIDVLYDKLRNEAKSAGYRLNPDAEFTKSLIRSLIVNQRRYGYQACPCRLASGEKQDDLDITCPCDYRDADLNEYGGCYCALYVSEAVEKGDRSAGSIPERRPPPEARKAAMRAATGSLSRVSMPVWRCCVCGYLCAREQPPEACPICKARGERFERFLEPVP